MSESLFYIDMKIRSKKIGRFSGSWVASLGLSLVLLLSTGVGACDVPVFRYALDTWPADAYEAVVINRGGDEAEASLLMLRDAATTTANVVVREVNPDQIPASFSQLLQEQPAVSTPWLILRFPVRQEARRTVWSGPLNRDAVSAWLDSPSRRELSRLLLEGRAGVWILLESGNRGKDKDAHDLLVTELARLERTLSLPTDYAPAESPSLSFAILRLSPDSPHEKELIAILRGSEPGLTQRMNEPMVFPVFGRGIILYALIGDGINTSTIAEAAEFMTGACSCEVKSQNPGIELLLSTDWGAAPAGGIADFASRAANAETLLAAGTVDAAPIPGLVGDVRADRGLPPASDVPPAETQHPRSVQSIVWVALGLIVTGVAVLTGLGLARRQRRSDT